MYLGTSPSRHILIITIIMIVMSTFNGIVIYHDIAKVQNDAKIINNAGIVRGSIQRIIKLELSGIHSDSLIAEINTLLEKFADKTGGFFLQEEDKDFYSKIDVLFSHWGEVKNAIEMYRTNLNEENRRHLIEMSEYCWVISNNIVLTAQLISETKIAYFRLVFVIIGFNILVLLFVIWFNLKYVRNRLEFLAHYDGLTCTLNRHSYEIIIDKETQKAERYEYLLSLLIIDIDNFKHVNDDYGHKKGDYVLRKLAGTVINTIRESDVFCRVGGEEFAVIAPGTPLSSSVQLAEKLRATIENTAFDLSGNITVSIGVAEYIKGDTPDSLFRRADNALYRAKAQGRNRVEEQIENDV